MGEKSERKESDDEMEIDFSRIRKFFSNLTTPRGKSGGAKETRSERGLHGVAQSAESSDSSDEISINPELAKKAKSFLEKHWAYFLVIIPIIIVITVRMQTPNLTIADDWGRGAVYDYYRNQIYQQLKSQNPNAPDENIRAQVEPNLNAFLKQNKQLVEQQVKSTAQQYKNFFQYEANGRQFTYMGDIDSYYWLRQAQNIIEKGSICDAVENGVCYDTYTLAPQKLRLYPTFHPYSIVAYYKAMKIFNPGITLMQAQILMATFYAVLVAVLVYFMMLKLFGPLAALTSSVLLSVSQIFLTRTLGGDNDNLIFPILVVFLAFEAFTCQGWLKKSIYAGLAGIAVGAYSFAWPPGWWYLFDFIVIALLMDYLYYLYRSISKKRRIDLTALLKDQRTIDFAATTLSFVIVSMITVSLIFNFSAFSVTYNGPFAFAKSKVAANPSLWPNVLPTVAEFNAASIPQVIGQMGGKGFFFLAMLGFLILAYKDYRGVAKNFVIFILSAALIYFLTSNKGQALSPMTYLILFVLPIVFGALVANRNEDEFDIKLAVLFTIWFCASVFAALKGVRFTLLLAAPVAIGIGISLGFLHDFATRIFAKAFKFNRAIISVLLFLAFAYLLLAPVEAGYRTGKGYLPNVNDQWWGALTQIRDNSQQDAIINSWWDFGHWFKYIADRRVTLDGSSQNSPQLHWLGRILVTPDEQEARGILRMLDCGGNLAFEEIEKKIKDIPKSILLLKKTLLVDRDEAKAMLLADGFNTVEANKVLDLSHCSPPENFFITSEDMVGKGGVWAHFGSWYFNRAWMHAKFDEVKGSQRAVDEFMKGLGITRQEAQANYDDLKGLENDNQVNAWISPWPSYAQGEAACQNSSDNVTVLVKCPFQQVQVYVNMTNMDAYIPAPQGQLRLNSFAYTTPTSIETKIYSANTIGISMVLMITESGYTSIFMAPQLANSTFTKLFYLDGHGTRYFDSFHDSRGMGNFRLKIWKVDWDGRNEPIRIARFNVTISARE